MTLPIREQALAAFAANLSAISSISDLRVERNRDTEVQHFPSLIVNDGMQSVRDNFSMIRIYDMAVEVEGYVEAASLGEAINALYAETLKAIMADRTLGGLCFDITEGESYFRVAQGPADKPAAAFSVTFNVSYITKESDPYTLAP